MNKDFDDYYDSDEWMEIEQANREYFETESLCLQNNKPMVSFDKNWNLLKKEKQLPQLANLQVTQLTNCHFSIWNDTDHISAQYDVVYASGEKILKRQTNGVWDKTDPRRPTENRALDAVQTMVVRSHDNTKIRFSRMYEPNQVKHQVREINLIELNDGEPLAAWFVLNNTVYPARLDRHFEDKYKWFLNGRNQMTIEEFCNWCWNIIP
jgi:hypothetical protein